MLTQSCCDFPPLKASALFRWYAEADMGIVRSPFCSAVGSRASLLHSELLGPTRPRLCITDEKHSMLPDDL